MPKGVYVRTEACRKILSDAATGKHPSLATREKMKKNHKGMEGQHHSPATIEKMTGENNYNYGKHLPKTQCDKISKSTMGRIPWNKGKTGVYSTDSKKKNREAHIGLYDGDKNPNWQGGVSFEPYSTDWTQTLRRSIRERDHYICQLCEDLQGDMAFDVHHIDYIKRNCNPENLITLCRKCNSKVNYNREMWTKYFQMKLGIIFD